MEGRREKGRGGKVGEKRKEAGVEGDGCPLSNS